MTDIRSPLQYLSTSTTSSLEAFELSRLNSAANLRKQERELCEERVRVEVEACFARWLLEKRRIDQSTEQMAEHDQLAAPSPDQLTFGFPSMNFQLVGSELPRLPRGSAGRDEALLGPPVRPELPAAVDGDADSNVASAEWASTAAVPLEGPRPGLPAIRPNSREASVSRHLPDFASHASQQVAAANWERLPSVGMDRAVHCASKKKRGAGTSLPAWTRTLRAGEANDSLVLQPTDLPAALARRNASHVRGRSRTPALSKHVLRREGAPVRRAAGMAR